MTSSLTRVKAKINCVTSAQIKENPINVSFLYTIHCIQYTIFTFPLHNFKMLLPIPDFLQPCRNLGFEKSNFIIQGRETPGETFCLIQRTPAFTTDKESCTEEDQKSELLIYMNALLIGFSVPANLATFSLYFSAKTTSFPPGMIVC